MISLKSYGYVCCFVLFLLYKYSLIIQMAYGE